MTGTWLCLATQDYTMFKVGHAWAILEGLGGPLENPVASPQTKSGRFSGIACLKLWDLLYVHTCIKCVTQVGSFFHLFLLYIY
jgi:hypothetical protein